MRELEIGVTCTKVSRGTTIYFERTYILPLFTDCPPWESNTRVGLQSHIIVLLCQGVITNTTAQTYFLKILQKKKKMVSAVSSWAYTLFLYGVNFPFCAQCLLSVWCLPKRGPSVEFSQTQCLIVRKRSLFQSSMASAKLKSVSEALRLSEFFISKFRFLSAQVSHSRSLLRKPFLTIF